MSNFKKLCEELEEKILDSYANGVSLEDAEKLAGQFLHAQIKVSEELKKADLDARMRRSGVKSIRAAIYMEAATKSDKKPSDVMLNAIVDMDSIVLNEQKSYDEAEVEAESLERYYDIFSNAHVHFRTIAKGRFE
jgi:hypothetical protein